MTDESKFRHGELTHKIIGLAMKVHSAMGPGFQEFVYQRCLAIEFKLNNIAFLDEFEMPIHYLGIQVASRRVDFYVEDSVMVELKAKGKLEDEHLAQALNYLEAHNLKIGLLLNFGAKSLEY